MSTPIEPFIDSHVHITGPDCLPFMKNYCSRHDFDAVNIACLGQKAPNDAVQNMLAAFLKLQDERFFAHGSLIYPSLPLDPTQVDQAAFARQAKQLEAIGFDGIKMLEGKPTTRKLIGIPQNSPIYDPFFAYLEQTGQHIIWHVADPETFWDRDKAPEFSIQSGWFYGDGTFLTKQQLYDEVLDVLNRFPRLNVTFAHFFFLSDFPDQAKDLLEQYPSVTLDITPGREMYGNFTKRIDIWRSFFETYADRILFGTDMTSTEFQGAAGDLIGAMKRFLTTRDRFVYWDLSIEGLGLVPESVNRIGKFNFTRLVGTNPRPINRKALKEYVEEHLPQINDHLIRKMIQEQYDHWCS